MSEATPPQGMERQEAPKRALVSHSDPKFGGKLGPFYGALHGEYKGEKDRLNSDAKPGAKVKFPSTYAVEVPEGSAERDEMLIELITMFFRALKNISEQNKDATATMKLLSEVDFMALTPLLKSIMPDPDSPEFTEMVSRRVAVNVGLTKAGFVEALATLVRFYDAFRDAAKTLQAAQVLAASVPGASGMVEVKDLPPAQWMAILGRRIVRFDDQASTPQLVAQNQELFEDRINQMGEECRSSLEAIYTVFVNKVAKFAREITGRDPTFIQCQWWNTLLNNLDKLDMDDEDSLTAQLKEIEDQLSSAKNATGFQKVINNIGKPPAAAETPAA